jgi:NTE family protein
MVVGCSGGSLYAAAIALGYDRSKMEDLTVRFWTNDIMKGYLSNLKASQSGEMRFDERSGLVDDSFMNNSLYNGFGDSTFTDARIPLTMAATDIANGEKVILSSGRLVDALRASAAIPIIFSPKEIDGQLLIDGAASDPLPVDVAIQAGAELIIVMGFTVSYRTKMRSMTAVQQQVTNIYINNILKASYAFYNLAHHAEIIPIIPDFDRPLSMFDTQHMPYIIEQGEKLMAQQLPYLKPALAALSA